MSAFVEKLRALGPLGGGEGIGERDLARKLSSLSRIVPFVKLTEREKLRVPEKSEEAYRALYENDDATKLVFDMIAHRLAVLETLSLLAEGPLTAREIADRLGLAASDVSRHLADSSRRGLVRYDVGEKRYALAGGKA
jgi:F420-non-reducing hydrogenase iron-sulfur subunit